jgi:hypothetical protein
MYIFVSTMQRVSLQWQAWKPLHGFTCITVRDRNPCSKFVTRKTKTRNLFHMCHFPARFHRNSWMVAVFISEGWMDYCRITFTSLLALKFVRPWTFQNLVKPWLAGQIFHDLCCFFLLQLLYRVFKSQGFYIMRTSHDKFRLTPTFNYVSIVIFKWIEQSW